jgi:hypothetical protein
MTYRDEKTASLMQIRKTGVVVIIRGKQAYIFLKNKPF